MARSVHVDIIGDSAPLERSFKRSSKASKEFAGSLGVVDRGLAKVGAGRAAFIGGFAGAGAGIIAPKVIDTLMDAVDVASSLNEQTSRSRVVFGQSSRAIEEWGRKTAKSIGVANDQALSFAGTFGALFSNTGSTQRDAAEFSKTLVQLGADMASFNDTTIDDALNALRSGLSGEIEPLRRFQVFLSEAAVQQRAMADTGKSSAKELTQGEKILARYNLILEQTTKQQGDFARTSGSFANQQRKLAAQTRDLQANLGRLLLPAMTKLTGALVEATDAALALTTALGKIGKIKIPTIEIPFITVQVPGTGGDLGDLIGKGLHFGKFLPSPLQGPVLAREIALLIAKQFDSSTKAEVPDLAREFATSINSMFQNALDVAAPQVETPKVPPAFGQPGFQPINTDAKVITGALDKAIAVFSAAAKKGAAAAKAAFDAEQRTKAAAEAARKQREAFDSLIDAINLSVSRAAQTRGIADDLKRNTQLQNAIRQQIRVEGRTTELARMLFEARQDRIRILEGGRQASQFRALGLSATGDEIVPGIRNLAKRIDATLRKVDLGKIDVSSKLVARLKAARKLIRTEGSRLTEETRRVINDFIKAATGQDAATKTNGPLTKTSALNVNQILSGLGLSRDELKALQSRLSGFNSAGLTLAGKTAAAGTGGFVAPPVIVESHTTITLDGDVVGRAVTRSQQKAARRNPPQRRGPNAR